MKKNIAWKEEDIRCWLLRVEIFEIVPEKASLRRSRCFCGDLKEVREKIVQIYLGRTFQGEGSASTKSLRWENVCSV